MTNPRAWLWSAPASLALTAALLAAGSPAEAATESFKLCAWPALCSSASITGTVDWSANHIDTTTVNAGYSRVTSTIHAGEQISFWVTRGGSRDTPLDFTSDTTTVKVTLCVPAVDAPHPCVDTTLTRPSE